MNQANCSHETIPGMGQEDFRFLSRYITSRLGITLSQDKKFLLESRLRPKLAHWGFNCFGSFRRHLAHVQDDQETLLRLGDTISTNKTDFFRDDAQFRCLRLQVLPQLLEGGAGVRTPLKVWSAACATGKEPYTLAMLLQEFAQTSPTFRFSILGTDLSPEALETAATGIYDANRIATVPEPLKKKYFLRSKDHRQRKVRVTPQLRGLVRFAQLNFMDSSYPVARDMDVIYLRNVLIYFNRTTQMEVLRKMLAHLRPGGFLFLGSAENISGMDLPLTQVAPNVYRK